MILVFAAAVLIALTFSGCVFTNQGSMTTEKNLSAFSSVSVFSSSADIELIESDEYGLEIFAPVTFDPRWDITDGKLTIQGKTRLPFINIFRNPGYYIRVYYPAGTDFNDVVLESASGDIALPLISAASLRIQSSSGSVFAEAEGCSSISIDTSSGDIKFSGSGDDVNISSTSGEVISVAKDYSANVSIETSSGDISFSGDGGNLSFNTSSGTIVSEADNCTAIRAETSSGDISLVNNGAEASTLNVRSTSGGITATGVVWQDVTANTSSGDIEIAGALLGNTDISTSSGGVELTVYGDASEYGFELTPNSGSIQWDGITMGSPARSSGSFDNFITVDTSSGDILVEFVEGC